MMNCFILVISIATIGFVFLCNNGECSNISFLSRYGMVLKFCASHFQIMHNHKYFLFFIFFQVCNVKGKIIWLLTHQKIHYLKKHIKERLQFFSTVAYGDPCKFDNPAQTGGSGNCKQPPRTTFSWTSHVCSFTDRCPSSKGVRCCTLGGTHYFDLGK